MGPWYATHLLSDDSGSAEVAVCDSPFLLVKLATECRSENHSSPRPQTDAIYRNPKASAENEADASATFHSFICCFWESHDSEYRPDWSIALRPVQHDLVGLTPTTACDRYALCIQHGLSKLSAAEDFNRAGHWIVRSD